MESYKNQPLLRQMFKEPPIISFKKGKSLKDMLVRAKKEKVNTKVSHRYGCAAYQPLAFSHVSFSHLPFIPLFLPSSVLSRRTHTGTLATQARPYESALSQ